MVRKCEGCAGEIPATKRRDAKYCAPTCQHNSWRKKDPEKAKATQQAWRAKNTQHLHEYEQKRYQLERYGVQLDNMTYKQATAVKRGILYGYRSGLEEEVGRQIEGAGHPVLFETDKIPYAVPARNAKYTPDFKLFRKDGSFFYVETKGLFETKDRQKHILLKEQGAPEVRFVFSRSKTKISKASKTTYAKWCDDHGFQYADKSIPANWFNE